MTDDHRIAELETEVARLLASLPSGATPGRYRPSLSPYSPYIVRAPEPCDDVTVGAQIVGSCDHDETRVLLAAAPSLRDALRATLVEVGRLRGEAKRERAAVVAWLRSRGMADYAQSNLDYAATMIERGEHRREEAP